MKKKQKQLIFVKQIHSLPFLPYPNAIREPNKLSSQLSSMSYENYKLLSSFFTHFPLPWLSQYFTLVLNDFSPEKHRLSSNNLPT